AGDYRRLPPSPDQPAVRGGGAVVLQTGYGLVLRGPARAGDTPDAYTAALPKAPVGTAWRMIGIDATVPFLLDVDERDDGILLLIEAAEVDGTELDLGAGWHGIELGTETPLLAAGNNTVRLAMGTRARFLPPVPADAAPPAVITRSVATTMNADVGSVLRLPFGFSLQSVTVAAIVDGVPGSDRTDAILVDAQPLALFFLGAHDEFPRPEVTWVGTSDPVRTAGEL